MSKKFDPQAIVQKPEKRTVGRYTREETAARMLAGHTNEEAAQELIRLAKKFDPRLAKSTTPVVNKTSEKKNTKVDAWVQKVADAIEATPFPESDKLTEAEMESRAKTVQTAARKGIHVLQSRVNGNDEFGHPWVAGQFRHEYALRLIAALS